MHLDLSSLRLFLAVCEEGNLTRAAERQHIAASALSKRVSDLEHMLKVRLFVRAPRGLVATPAGEALARHARALAADLSRLEDEMGAFANGRRGKVRVHATVAALEGFLSIDLPAFSKLHPDVTVEVQDCLSLAAVRAVREHDADVGVYSAGIPAPGLRTLPYRMQHLVAVLPCGHPLAERESVTLADMLPHEMVCVRIGSALDVQIREAATALGGNVRYRIRVSGYDGLAEIIGTGGQGIGIAPANCVRAHLSHSSVVTRTLDEPWAERRLGICHAEAGAATASAVLCGEFLAARAESTPVD
jgi:DNA-binding transcriptional LysR family regulator